MEDRYEIKGKIGQGGLGSVYRAYDVRMHREVAIKRIIADSDDNSISAEATRQLIKEAGSLASLQHPNIVTIYDVGSDEDGPFVVMELLTGDTLEELIGKGSFTWADFRQLAMHTLEALIAAQELHLVHRDLKPSNIMLTWLPSGKFQVKIVDFGLAKLSAKPSLQTIDQSDGVFGSIYFMAPEQFERVPIDLKTDLYAIGCVFYYALTGTYPFDGDTAAEVMAAHLQHHVAPLQEVREGIPLWACDWIMWHLNRQATDRPESARESLRYFVANDEQPSPTMSTGTPAAPVVQPKRPRLIVPGSAPIPEVVNEPTPTQTLKTASAPKPLAPPKGSKPSVHTTAQVTQSAPIQSDDEPEDGSEEAEPPSVPSDEEAVPTLASADSVPAASSPLVLARASSAPISISKATQPVTPAVVATGPLAPASAAATSPAVASASQIPAPKKKGLSSGVKTAIALVLGLLAVILAVYFVKKSGQNAEALIYNRMISQAAEPGATEVPVTQRDLDILLRTAVSVALNKDREAVYMALFLAKSTDGTDVDARIAEFATTREMIPDVRVVLIRNVLRKRNNPAIIGTLLNFARTTKEAAAAVGAIEATRFMAKDEHFPEFIRFIQETKDDTLRKAAEENAAKIIEKSAAKAPLGDALTSAYGSAPNEVARHSMLRLLGRIGGDNALELAKKNLDSEDVKDKIAAVVALGSWADQSGYKMLIEFLGTKMDLTLRTRSFDSAFQYASESEENEQENWTLLSAQAKTQAEQLKLIRGLVNVDPAPWALALLKGFAENSDYAEAKDLAERAIIRLKDIQNIQGNDPEEEE